MNRSLDPRVQLVAIIVAMTLTIVFRDWPPYLVLTGYLLLQLVLVHPLTAQVRRISWLILGVAIFTMMLHLLFGSPHGDVILNIAGIVITEGKMVDGVLYSWRVVILFIIAAWLMAVIDRDRLADVFLWALKPLGALGVPIGGVTMSLRIALRTIPYLQNEHSRIKTAQQARGAFFGGSILKRIRRHSHIMVPLLAATLRRGDRLGDALQVRHWRSNINPTSLQRFETGWIDVAQLILVALLITATAVLA